MFPAAEPCPIQGSSLRSLPSDAEVPVACCQVLPFICRSSLTFVLEEKKKSGRGKGFPSFLFSKFSLYFKAESQGEEHYKMSCLVASSAFSAPLLFPAVPLLSCISFVAFYAFLLSSLVYYSLCCILGPFRMSFLIFSLSLLSDVLSIAKTRGVCICSDNSRLNASKILYPYVNMKAVINLPLEICS